MMKRHEKNSARVLTKSNIRRAELEKYDDQTQTGLEYSQIGRATSVITSGNPVTNSNWLLQEHRTRNRIALNIAPSGGAPKPRRSSRRIRSAINRASVKLGKETWHRHGSNSIPIHCVCTTHCPAFNPLTLTEISSNTSPRNFFSPEALIRASLDNVRSWSQKLSGGRRRPSTFRKFAPKFCIKVSSNILYRFCI